MPIDYAAANALWRRHRTALTRALNKAKRENTVPAWEAVIDTVIAQQVEWDNHGWPWPDDWSRWNRAIHDAQFARRRLVDYA